MLKEFDIIELAGQLYTEYCTMVGGKAYDGKPLPTWKEFSADSSRLIQFNAWCAVAYKALEELRKHAGVTS